MNKSLVALAQVLLSAPLLRLADRRAFGLNNHYWTFAGGLTNVQVTTTVTDTVRGTVKTCTNPPGRTFQPIQDTSAFLTCP